MSDLHTLYKQYLSNHKRRQNKGAGFSKDSEQGKVYASEWAITKHLYTKKNKFKDIQECQNFVNRVVQSKTWSKVKRPLRSVMLVEMKDKSGGVAGLSYGSRILLKPRYGFDKYTILHELAHSAGHSHHGRSFRQTLLKLVSAFLGRREANLLKQEFKKRKLSFGEARKPLTFDQWLAKRERLNKAKGL